ncbi:MAG TPA: VCBS repeat-containing protein [Verrucomicrobiae bacterium]
MRNSSSLHFLTRLLALGLTFTAVPGLSQPIQLQPGSPLLSGAVTLDVGDYAIPCATDWNGDGRQDLLVGYRYADKIAVILNAGSETAPVFYIASNLQAGGVDIQHPSTGCGAPAPFVCDFDNDGKRDLLVGSGPDGLVYFYRNTSTDSSPILAPGVPLMVGSANLTVYSRATPFVYDWDGDGLKDLLCGDGNGAVNFFKNVGTTRAPAFAPATQLQAGGVVLNLGMRSIVRMWDWDGDGVEDLVGSSASGVYWCRNGGTANAPVLLAPAPVRAPVVTGGLQPINTGARMRLDLLDLNNDGVIDLLVGNVDGTISYFEGYRFEFTQASMLQPARCAFQWNSAPHLSYHVFGGASLASSTNLLVTNLPSTGRVTGWTNPPVSANRGFYRLQIAE